MTTREYLDGAETLARRELRWRDRVEKLRWYRHYGVREYWLVDTHAATIDVLALTRERSRRRTFTGPRPVRSHVFPRLTLLAEESFAL